MESREGVPVLGDLPVLGGLFSNRAINSVNNELVVLITPYIIDHEKFAVDQNQGQRINGIAQDLEVQPTRINRHFEKMDYLDEMVGRADPGDQPETSTGGALYSIIDD